MDRTTLAQMARRHWNQWLPAKVARLKAEGTLNEAIQGAALRAQRGITELMSQGYQAHEAEEVVLPQFVLLEPEADAVDSPEEKAELAQMERQYQREMKGFTDPD